MAEIILQGITKVYENGNTAVKDLNLTIHDGDFLVLVGPSGCGKTTALRMVAGLEEITDGTCTIDGQVVNDLDPGKRDIAMVFQNYALYPHMSVYDNMAFPLKCRRVPKEEIKKKVTAAAEMLGLSDFLKRKPRTLSGGQRQRVAMGRCIVREPKAFLMDEPLSNLDAKLRVQMRSEICALQQKMGITTIYVTHDQVEAMTMGTHIAIMRFGVLQQFGTPQEVFNKPSNIFVASFIGSPSMNFAMVTITKDEKGYMMTLGEQVMRIPDEIIEANPNLKEWEDKKIIMGVRPDHLLVGKHNELSFRATVTHTELLGASQLVYVEAAGESVSVEQIINGEDATEEEVELLKGEESVRFLLNADSLMNVETGSEIDLSIRTDCLHFFDPNGGETILK